MIMPIMVIITPTIVDVVTPALALYIRSPEIIPPINIKVVARTYRGYVMKKTLQSTSKVAINSIR